MSPIFPQFGGGKMGVHLHTPKHEQQESHSEAQAFERKHSRIASVATFSAQPCLQLGLLLTNSHIE